MLYKVYVDAESEARKQARDLAAAKKANSRKKSTGTTTKNTEEDLIASAAKDKN
eukprot:CAMPEP_0185596512 /NCGR_PEP_ID=MMETSP0434-20130131/80801_1 /TAXON_ID=626734 ORGANISM="Favella taraikaensis, Strain Fe Narragansett Bay" /NCGR_SAMPLE_ID=MMETSP0434 /ASSEMBLY_ACC=CAM_ASM_000379 /LENGTH=53 /DNA_ID=CAMNT_0028225029 /DNA_START=1571 /DNA_END=1732 /DNA_ORIENTATION=-